MTHGIRHFVWRNGRPRWVPSRAGRALGLVGQDLKSDDGDWLPLKQALAAAEKLNTDYDKLRAGTGGKPRERANTAKAPDNLNEGGYVYFLWSADKVKIGFSLDPFRRMREIKTSVSSKIEKFVVVPGRRFDEQRLHKRFASSHSYGEWFRPSPELTAVILEMLQAGTANIR